MSAVTAIRGRHQVVNKVVVNVALLLLAAGFFVPLLWLVLAAFDARAGAAVAWPHPWTSTNFKAILTWDTTYRPMLNGAILCGGGTVVCVLASVLAAYPLSRYQFRAKRPFLLTILFATGLPITAIMVPVYGLFVQVDLIDTLSWPGFRRNVSRPPGAVGLVVVPRGAFHFSAAFVSFHQGWSGERRSCSSRSRCSTAASSQRSRSVNCCCPSGSPSISALCSSSSVSVVIGSTHAVDRSGCRAHRHRGAPSRDRWTLPA